MTLATDRKRVCGARDLGWRGSRCVDGQAAVGDQGGCSSPVSGRAYRRCWPGGVREGDAVEVFLERAIGVAVDGRWSAGGASSPRQ
jgi:hypothetical protein